MHVLGTAGHVDHGKSTLIRALTGIDPDRLAEEKARGLTIDLGFAWMTLPSGREVGFVDVPGHERFVHNMLAGVGQIDATIFVVAADEGWKPQSEEHLAILDLLGARGGLVVLTKADAAHDIDAVEASIRARLRGTVLDGSPVIRVSALTGAGMKELVAALDAMLERTPEAADAGRPRMFVDRSFSIKGAGTVVTGTLTGGSLATGGEVVVLPAGTPARIRSIQTHQVARDDARPGSRVALNLAGLDRREIGRGDAVVTPGNWRPTTVLDVRLRAVRSLDHAVSPRGAYLLYAGTAEVGARLRLLDATELAAGAEAFARLTLTAPVVAGMFDRLVLRDTGRRSTVAGGIVLDPHPVDDRLGDDARSRRVAELRARAEARPETVAGVVLAERGVLAREDFGWLCGARAAGHGVALDTHVASEEWFEQTTTAIIATLERMHAARPLERGIDREEVRSLAGGLEPRLFAEVIDALKDHVVAEGPLLRLASHRVELSGELSSKRAALLKEIEGFSPPSLAGLEQTYGAALVKALLDAGELIKIAPDIAYSATSMADARRVITDTIEAEGPASASRLREALGTTRKWTIPLLEYLDAAGVTVRRDDLRDLRR